MELAALGHELPMVAAGPEALGCYLQTLPGDDSLVPAVAVGNSAQVQGYAVDLQMPLKGLVELDVPHKVIVPETEHTTLAWSLVSVQASQTQRTGEY